MRNIIRRAAISSGLAIAVACGSPSEQQGPPPQGSALTTPESGAAGTPPSTPGADMRGAASSAPGGADAPAVAAAPPAPVMMAMDVPSGTELSLILETSVSSETAKPEQAVRARVAKPVVISGMTVIPEGAPVTGTVVSAERSGRVKGRASVALRFNSVTVANTPYTINTARISRQAEATKGEDATKIGIGAGVGAAIGAIAGGKKGAAIGAGVGGGAGTGAVLATRGEEVTIPAGATLRTTIQETVNINAPM
jgi:hypothetical protein